MPQRDECNVKSMQQNDALPERCKMPAWRGASSQADELGPIVVCVPVLRMYSYADSSVGVGVGTCR